MQGPEQLLQAQDTRAIGQDRLRVGVIGGERRRQQHRLNAQRAQRSIRLATMGRQEQTVLEQEPRRLDLQDALVSAEGGGQSLGRDHHCSAETRPCEPWPAHSAHSPSNAKKTRLTCQPRCRCNFACNFATSGVSNSNTRWHLTQVKW